jgi:hypothetical protein
MSQWDEVDTAIARYHDEADTSDYDTLLCMVGDILDAIEAARAERCVWREDDESIWSTACGREWCTQENISPSELGATHCQFCGRPVEAVPFTERDQ